MTDLPPADGLHRFVTAQDGLYDLALGELNRGRKESHWMWFIFPQLRGLGRSPMAHRYGIADLAEAEAYLAHDVLGPRLLACAEATLSHAGTPAETIFGPIDAAKLRSSTTLFAAATAAPSSFDRILEVFFDGQPCPLTQDRLNNA